jgi:hypothetical protein
VPPPDLANLILSEIRIAVPKLYRSAGRLFLIVELIDLQPDKKDHSKAKIYQVQQVRNFIEKYMEV